jgi:hypothetical protein
MGVFVDMEAPFQSRLTCQGSYDNIRAVLVWAPQDAPTFQARLAKALGCTQRMISYNETEAELPPSLVIVALARILRMSADELLGLKPAKLQRQSSEEQCLRRHSASWNREGGGISVRCFGLFTHIMLRAAKPAHRSRTHPSHFSIPFFRRLEANKAEGEASQARASGRSAALELDSASAAPCTLQRKNGTADSVKFSQDAYAEDPTSTTVPG